MKTKILKYTILLFALIVAACSEDTIDDSGKGSITGKVVIAGNNTPLENVKIETSPVSTTVFTNANGEFLLEDVPTGSYSVQAQIEGYISSFKPANVTDGQISNVIFELQISTANNQPPSTPELISPAENEILTNIEAVFIWSSTDPDDDNLSFTLELKNDLNNDVEIFEDITDTTFTHSPLLFGAKYFWQVTASDEINTPVLSPVGSFRVHAAPTENRFLFARNVDGNMVIFSADNQGNEFQLTSSDANSFRPRRNVASNKIAYLQTNGTQVDIYTMNRDGSNKFKVTSSIKPNGFNFNEINIAWPHNSDMIYFPSFDKLYRINSNGQGVELVYQTPDSSLISEIDVNESLNMIALKTNDINGYHVKIYTINFSGTTLFEVLTDVTGAAGGLQISVDGNSIVYSYDVSGFENSEYRRLESRIFIYDVLSNTATQVLTETPSGTNDLEPRFSPNEAFVIFTNTSNDGISQKDIYQFEIINPEDRTLLYNNAAMPDWK